jgi:excisionase family DNA binding protein
MELARPPRFRSFVQTKRPFAYMPIEDKQSFSTSEVAAYCHVTPDTIRKWAEAGRIQVFKTPGGHRRIRRDDLIRFLNDNEIPIHNDLNEGGVRILVAESEGTAATVIRRFLDRSRTPFEVDSATDAFDAGRKLASRHPDVVFFDVRLPGVDAFDVFRMLAHSEEYANTKVIALTPPSDNDLAARATDSGATLSMRKHFTPDDLRRALARVGIDLT